MEKGPGHDVMDDVIIHAKKKLNKSKKPMLGFRLDRLDLRRGKSQSGHESKRLLSRRIGRSTYQIGFERAANEISS